MGIFLTDSTGLALTSDETLFLGQNLVDNSDEVIPVVTPASFSLQNAPNTFIGVIAASNAPTSFAIVSGDAGGYFTIDNAGNLSTSATSAPNGVYSLGVTASNASGTSAPATITVSLVSGFGFRYTSFSR